MGQRAKVEIQEMPLKYMGKNSVARMVKNWSRLHREALDAPL